jgi:cytochrome b
MATVSTEAQPEGARRGVRIWDPLTRLFHWSLVAAFTLSYVSGEAESSWHDWAGYAVAGLVAFRLVWGLAGPRHARFRDFLRPPGEILAYTRALLAGRPQRYLGHNPLGGLMIVALLASLALSAATGYALERSGDIGEAAASAVTPIAFARTDVDHHEKHSGAPEWLEETHEWFAHLTLLLVFVHVAGVVVMSLVHRENLVRAMITGRKRA